MKQAGSAGPGSAVRCGSRPARTAQPRERVVGPLELFYDLAVVVLVAQAAHHLAGHLTWRGLGEFAVIVTPAPLVLGLALVLLLSIPWGVAVAAAWPTRTARPPGNPRGLGRAATRSAA